MPVVVDKGYDNEERYEDATTIDVQDGHLILGYWVEESRRATLAAIAPGAWRTAEALPLDK
jgi:hypothetical protein